MRARVASAGWRRGTSESHEDRNGTKEAVETARPERRVSTGVGSRAEVLEGAAAARCRGGRSVLWGEVAGRGERARAKVEAAGVGPQNLNLSLVPTLPGCSPRSPNTRQYPLLLLLPRLDLTDRSFPARSSLSAASSRPRSMLPSPPRRQSRSRPSRPSFGTNSKRFGSRSLRTGSRTASKVRLARCL